MPKAVITFVFKVLRNGLLRCKTRQLEHENTFCRFRVFAFPSFCAFPISVRLCLIASAIIDCNVFLLSAKTVFLLCAFSRFRRFRVFVLGVSAVFAVFGFSRFRVPPAASPRPGHRFRVHRKSVGVKFFNATWPHLPRSKVLWHLLSSLWTASSVPHRWLRPQPQNARHGWPRNRFP